MTSSKIVSKHRQLQMILIGQPSDDKHAVNNINAWYILAPRGCADLTTGWGFSRNTSKQGPPSSYGVTNVGIRQILNVEVLKQINFYNGIKVSFHFHIKNTPESASASYKATCTYCSIFLSALYM